MYIPVILGLPMVLSPFGSTSILSSTHLSSVGGANGQHLYKAHGLTAPSGHTVNDNILILGDELLDHVYSSAVGFKIDWTHWIRRAEKSSVLRLIISSSAHWAVATYQEDQSLGDPVDHFQRSIHQQTSRT